MKPYWWSILALLVPIALSTCAAAGDVAQTAGERIEGQVQIQAGQFKVGDKTIHAEEVLLLVRQSASQTISESQAIRLRDGEVWYADISRLAAKKIKFSSAMLGEREIDVALVSAIDFIAHPEAGNSAGTLYRDFGSAIPGTVMFIDPQRFTLESPLGIVTLPREGLLRYVFPEPNAAVASAAAADELWLIDGSIYKGKIALAEGKVELDHALLGHLILPTQSVRAIIRKGITPIANITIAQAELIAPAGKPQPATAITAQPSSNFLTAYKIEPQATATIHLSTPGTFKAFIQPMVSSSGLVKVTVSSNNQPLLTKTLAPGDPGLPISAENDEKIKTVPGTVVILVEFVGEPQFPCGILLCDPVVIAKP